MIQDAAAPHAATARAICDLVDDGAVLALGEPTHGTAEAFALKFEVLTALAQQGRLAMLAFEDSWPVGLQVDAALHGHGDLDAVWSRALSVWRTRTILDGLHRLRKITMRTPPAHRLRFVGLDSKRPKLAAADLESAGVSCPGISQLAACGDIEPADVEEALRVCEHTAARAAGRRLRGSARQLYRRLDAYHREPDLAGLGRRDAHMATTLLEERAQHASRTGGGVTAVWAHNEHVSLSEENFGSPAMGRFLWRELGDAYTAVGILCGDGTCRAVDPSSGDDGYRTVPLPPVRSGSTEAALRERGDALVTRAEFRHAGPRRFVGWKVDSAAEPDTFDLARPSTDFDAIAWLETSRADVGLEGGGLEVAQG